MSGFRLGSTHFDDLFDPDIMGDGPEAAGLKVGATPLRYAKLSYGSKRANVGVVHGGADVSNLWAAKGTAQYVGDGGLPAYLGEHKAVPRDEGGYVSVNLTFARNGVVSWTTMGSGGGSGTWAPGGSTVGDAYDIRFTLITGSGGQLNGANGLWQQVNASRSLSASASTQPGGFWSADWTVRIEIRRRSDGTVLLNRTLELSLHITGDA